MRQPTKEEIRKSNNEMKFILMWVMFCFVTMFGVKFISNWYYTPDEVETVFTGEYVHSLENEIFWLKEQVNGNPIWSDIEVVVTGTVDGCPCAYDVWINGELKHTQDNCTMKVNWVIPTDEGKLHELYNNFK